MANKWIEGIREKKKLTVFIQPGVAKSRWSGVVPASIKEFNRLMEKNKIDIQLIVSKDSPTDKGGADVSIDLGNGEVEIDYRNEKKVVKFDGRTAHGYTGLMLGDSGIEKAFVFLPADPQINTPQKKRPCGDGVLKFIAVHELIHACGLRNADHNPADVFHGSPTLDSGDTPAQDTVLLTVKGKYVRMPPISLDSETVRRIKDNWA